MAGMVGMPEPTFGSILKLAAAGEAVRQMFDGLNIAAAAKEVFNRNATRAELRMKLEVAKENDLEKRRELGRAAKDFTETLDGIVEDNPEENPGADEGAQPDTRWFYQKVCDHFAKKKNTEQLENEKKIASEEVQKLRRQSEELELRIKAVRDRMTEAERMAAERFAVANQAALHDRATRTGWFGWW